MSILPQPSGSSRTQSLGSWQSLVSKTYFDLDLSSPTSQSFEGVLGSWEFGAFGVSILQSTPVMYRRRRESCGSHAARILVTVPIEGRIDFSQFNRQAVCGTGGFVIEASDEPYVFAQAISSKLLVFRANEDALRDRVHDLRSAFATVVDGRNGLGGMFVDVLTLAAARIARDPERLLPRLGPHLLDLLALALEGEPKALGSSLSCVKAGHLARVDRHIEEHLSDPDLSLGEVARACGLSLRYLHRLFHDAGSTGGQYIRDRRLDLANHLLQRAPTGGGSIASLAYRVGYSDQAHFSRAFKAKFGHSPSESRARRMTY
ncbi:AraC family transcriptional regulator [Lichenihabitans sp. PAMC28606]|uniref:AraC family transcriptional regulator n=1 Tax=Lichenihabitans sp. PAMC28606 TaxID=2880932 RepID=UPI001D0A9E70|nr:AraC family transcriptional regulator [Lichenihabitans sp. PAMC28606]UDL93937.1 AraC family transcriptional regulator [Lichenihabitans sp. PAMC28606]